MGLRSYLISRASIRMYRANTQHACLLHKASRTCVYTTELQDTRRHTDEGTN